MEQCSFYIQVIRRKITRATCIIRMQNEKKVVFREKTGKTFRVFVKKVEKTFLFFVKKVPYTFLFFVI